MTAPPQLRPPAEEKAPKGRRWRGPRAANAVSGTQDEPEADQPAPSLPTSDDDAPKRATIKAARADGNGPPPEPAVASGPTRPPAETPPTPKPARAPLARRPRAKTPATPVTPAAKAVPAGKGVPAPAARPAPAAAGRLPPTPPTPPTPPASPERKPGRLRRLRPTRSVRLPKADKPVLTPRQIVLRQRRRRRRTIIGVTIFLVVVNLIVGSGVAYVRWRLGEIHRVKVPGLAEDNAGQPMNVLLVGSDSRAGLTGDAAAQAGQGQVSGERSDTIMVLHVDPGQRKAAILSIPRDLYLPIAGTGRSDKVNAAFASGGAAQLIATVQQGLGIQINHYAEVDFVGFKDIVDAVGGVTVYVPTQARDAFTGLQVGTPGCFRLDGIAALAWVRSRHYEYMSDGKWVEDPRGDLGRIERQQDFIRRMMKKAVSSGISNPLTLNRLIGIGVGKVTLDSTMSTGDITRLGRRFSSLNPDVVQTLTLPTTPADLGGPGGSVLMLNRAGAQPSLDVINGKSQEPTTTTLPPTTAAPTTPVVAAPASAIQVLNGTGAAGKAGAVATQLKGAGFTVSGLGDTAATARTTIRYPKGAEAQAQALAARLSPAALLRADTTLKPRTLVLVVGADFQAVNATATTPGATTTVPAGPVPTPIPNNAAPRKGC